MMAVVEWSDGDDDDDDDDDRDDHEAVTCLHQKP
jgi:hypothetical protein